MSRTIDPGRFRRRIQIHADTPTEDDTGQAISGFALVTTVWGAVDPMRGEERFQALKATPIVTHRVTMRDYPLTAQHRLIDAEDTTVEWDIVSVLRLDDEGARYIEAWCKERVGE